METFLSATLLTRENIDHSIINEKLLNPVQHLERGVIEKSRNEKIVKRLTLEILKGMFIKVIK